MSTAGKSHTCSRLAGLLVAGVLVLRGALAVLAARQVAASDGPGLALRQLLHSNAVGRRQHVHTTVVAQRGQAARVRHPA